MKDETAATRFPPAVAHLVLVKAMRSLLCSKFFAPTLSAMLFILFFPLLDTFTHPFSVLHGDYIPLVIRLSELYWDTAVLRIAVFGIPLLLLTVLVLAQSRHFAPVHSALLVLAPFVAALFFQYFIAVQLDNYLIDFPAAGLAIPWQYIFQGAFIVHCLQMLLVYAGIMAMLWLLIFAARHAVSFALSMR
jgi:hypothetical protein